MFFFFSSFLSPFLPSYFFPTNLFFSSSLKPHSVADIGAFQDPDNGFLRTPRSCIYIYLSITGLRTAGNHILICPLPLCFYAIHCFMHFLLIYFRIVQFKLTVSYICSPSASTCSHRSSMLPYASSCSPLLSMLLCAPSFCFVILFFCFFMPSRSSSIVFQLADVFQQMYSMTKKKSI